MSDSQADQNRKYLVIQTAFIGDVILATPLAQVLKQNYPGCTIHYLVRKGNEQLLEGNSDIDQIIVWDKSKRKYQNLLKTIRLVRKVNYTAVYNIQRFLSTGLITLFARSPMKIGFGKNPLSIFFNKKIPHYTSPATDPNPIHEVQRNLSLIDSQIKEFIRPKLYSSADDKSIVSSLMDGKKFVVFAPSSVWFTKQWPIIKWAELAARIPAQVNIYLVGSLSDFSYCEEIALGKNNIQNLCGKLTVNQTAWLMNGAIRVFTNDSAPLHLASAMNVATTAIFCSTIPAFGFYPLAENSRIVETNLSLSCRPCGLHGKPSCPKLHFDCAQSISPKMVLPADDLAHMMAISCNVEEQIQIASEYLQAGKIIIHETDTVPGLAVAALDEIAIASLFKLKAREASKPMLILCDSIEMIRQYVEKIPAKALQILKLDEAGPITIIYPHSKNLPNSITGPDGSIAIRIPANENVKKLIRKSGIPIVSTSANLAGNAPPKTLREIEEIILSQADLIIPEGFGNNDSEASSSTIIKFQDNKPVIIRKGNVSKELSELIS